jgi:hypothetical protein
MVKNSPEILMVAGVVGVVTSTVLACKATTKLSGILESKNEQVIAVKNAIAHPEQLSEEYTEEDGKKDLTIIYTKTTMSIVKEYAPAAIIGVASLAALISSNGILKKRNVALAAAYTTIDGAFKKYRKNVVDRFGETVDKELRYSAKQVTVEKEVETKKGKKTVTETVSVPNIDQYSDYARVFDASSTNWKKDPEYNLMFLRAQQAYANNMLQVNGYVFLNDVYDLLGMDRTKAGQVVGWVKDSEIGDGQIDFGIYDLNDKDKCAFINGYEPNIILDFNVDGNIWDLMN